MSFAMSPTTATFCPSPERQNIILAFQEYRALLGSNTGKFMMGIIIAAVPASFRAFLSLCHQFLTRCTLRSMSALIQFTTAYRVHDLLLHVIASAWHMVGSQPALNRLQYGRSSRSQSVNNKTLLKTHSSLKIPVSSSLLSLQYTPFTLL